jgi:tetratricopeptide (TPR) repeat protein
VGGLIDRLFFKKRPKYVWEKIMRVILITFFLVFCSSSSNPAAQNTTGNRKAKCDEVVVRDKSHPVWKAIDAQYAKLAEAMRKKDVDALFALYTPDFHAVTPTGEVWTRERSLAYQRNGLAQVKETTHISNTILRLTICGDEATATVLQQWYRTQMMAGKPRRVETNAVQDEKWVKTPDGWKRGDIFEVKNGAAFVDGKRVDTNKPYDPEAPAYDPYDPHPKRPVAEALLPIITEKGIESALQSYRALKQSNDYYVSENQLNALGYRLLSMKKVREAIEIFKLNVEAYPQSANVYDSLGEAYMMNGDKDPAIRNYQRAVELNPQNTNAIEMLKKLRAQ